MLEIPRKKTAEKGRGDIVFKEKSIEPASGRSSTPENPSIHRPIKYGLRNNATDVQPVDALAAGVESPSYSPNH